MGILSRFRDVMTSNVYALLERTDDPERAIERYMRSMQQDLGQVKAESASVQAHERRARRALEESQAEMDKLHRYAERAVMDGNEQQARKFLERKSDQARKHQVLKATYDQAAAAATGIERMQDKLTADLSRLEERRAQLKGKMAETRQQQRLNAMNTGGEGASSVFGELEGKVNQAYDEAMALAELRSEHKDDLDELIAELERQEAGKNVESDGKDHLTQAGDIAPDPEAELAALKAKLERRE
ncbi:hypothetical protein D3C74_53510 [compost metagenome]